MKTNTLPRLRVRRSFLRSIVGLFVSDERIDNLLHVYRLNGSPEVRETALWDYKPEGDGWVETVKPNGETEYHRVIRKAK